MAQVTITKITVDWSKVVIDPPIDGSKELLINHEINVARVRLLDDPLTADMVKIYMVDGEVLELHYSVGVEVDNGVDPPVVATSNQHLIDLIENLFTT